MGTELKHTLAYSSEENAIVERANKEVNRHLRVMIFNEQDIHSLPKMLPCVMRIIKTTRNTGTGITPSELMYGKMIDLDEGILLDSRRIRLILRHKSKILPASLLTLMFWLTTLSNHQRGYTRNGVDLSKF